MGPLSLQIYMYPPRIVQIKEFLLGASSKLSWNVIVSSQVYPPRGVSVCQSKSTWPSTQVPRERSNTVFFYKYLNLMDLKSRPHVTGLVLQEDDLKASWQRSESKLSFHWFISNQFFAVELLQMLVISPFNRAVSYNCTSSLSLWLPLLPDPPAMIQIQIQIQLQIHKGTRTKLQIQKCRITALPVCRSESGYLCCQTSSWSNTSTSM